MKGFTGLLFSSQKQKLSSSVLLPPLSLSLCYWSWLCRLQLLLLSLSLPLCVCLCCSPSLLSPLICWERAQGGRGFMSFRLPRPLPWRRCSLNQTFSVFCLFRFWGMWSNFLCIFSLSVSFLSFCNQESISSSLRSSHCSYLKKLPLFNFMERHDFRWRLQGYFQYPLIRPFK